MASTLVGARAFWLLFAIVVGGILAGRLLIAGGAALVALVVVGPVLFLLLARSAGPVPALIVIVGIAAMALVARAYFLAESIGWLPLLLFPFLAVVGNVAWKVARQMRMDARRGAVAASQDVSEAGGGDGENKRSEGEEE